MSLGEMFIFKPFKGTVSVISSDPLGKDRKARFTPGTFETLI